MKNKKSATIVLLLSFLAVIVVLTTDEASKLIKDYKDFMDDPKSSTMNNFKDDASARSNTRRNEVLALSSNKSSVRATRPFYLDHHSLPETLEPPTLSVLNNTNNPVPTSLSFVNVKPMFTCRDQDEQSRTDKEGTINTLPGRKQKLVFVHIFKTAGTTMRGLFKRYAQACGAGWQLTIRCTGANETSVLSSSHPTLTKNQSVVGAPSWFNYNYQEPCVAKKGIWRDGTKMLGSLNFNSDFLQQHVDILGGHMELGVADYTWNQYDDLRYITFFRNAISMFVSAKMYRKERTLEGHVDFIKRFVKEERLHDKYAAKYQNYLLTPYQKAAIQRSSRQYSYQQRAHLIQQNIIHYRIVCGITERMPESLQILHYLIDSDDGAREIFEEWGMPNKDGSHQKEQHRSNVHYETDASAIVTTSSVIEELKKDKDFFEELTEYTKFEQSITDFALEVHHKQYESVVNAS